MEILINQETEELILDEKFKKLINDSILKTLETVGLGSDYEISITIVDEEDIRQLNFQYRGVDKSTDVLSFPLYERDEIPDFGMLGDIVICSRKVKEQAKDFEHSEEREFSYLTVHSMLHLLGYDHIDEEDRFEMRNKEKMIMKSLGIYKSNRINYEE